MLLVRYTRRFRWVVPSSEIIKGENFLMLILILVLTLFWKREQPLSSPKFCSAWWSFCERWGREPQSLLVHFCNLQNYTVTLRAWSEGKSTTAHSLLFIVLPILVCFFIVRGKRSTFPPLICWSELAFVLWLFQSVSQELSHLVSISSTASNGTPKWVDPGRSQKF